MTVKGTVIDQLQMFIESSSKDSKAIGRIKNFTTLFIVQNIGSHQGRNGWWSEKLCKSLAVLFGAQF